MVQACVGSWTTNLKYFALQLLSFSFFFCSQRISHLWFTFPCCPLTGCPFNLPCSLVGQHHKDSDNLDYKLQLEIWKGNLGGALEMAANSKQLTEWLVSLSPLGNMHLHHRHLHSNVNCSPTPLKHSSCKWVCWFIRTKLISHLSASSSSTLLVTKCFQSKCFSL